MKEFTLELIQGKEILGSWSIGREPLTLRITHEGTAQLEVNIKIPTRSAKKDKTGFLFDKGPEDDFTMPLPVETSGQSQSLSDFVQEENKKVKQKINQTQDEDDSLHFDVENFSEHSEDDEPMMDIVSFTEIELDEEVEYISNPDRVLKNLRQSLQIMNSSSVTKGERPPEIPLIPSMGQIRIAVWYQQNGEWQYSTHLEAGNEITFKGIG